jgi:hypothetical protein
MQDCTVASGIWISVPGFEDGYEINRYGIIRSKNSRYLGHVIPKRKNNSGYWSVRLNKQGRPATQLLHRLLALTFLSNPEGKSEVNHINGIKTDYRLENLEWVTRSENMQHAYKIGLINKVRQMKMVVNACTGETYKNVKEAARAISIPYSSCKNYLNGRRPNITCLKYAA